jgi:hypothetical protein
MSQVIARFPVLADGRVLGFVAAAALAVLSFIAGGDAASAQSNITGGR